MYQTLDFFADRASPIFGIFLLVVAIFWLKTRAPLFLLRCVVAVALSQQISKFAQKHAGLGADFPSTHFAVALALATCFQVLKPKFWPISVAFAVLYGVLMLVQNYHTPLEMAGAFYAIPLSLFFLLVGRKRENAEKVAAN